MRRPAWSCQSVGLGSAAPARKSDAILFVTRTADSRTESCARCTCFSVVNFALHTRVTLRSRQRRSGPGFPLLRESRVRLPGLCPKCLGFCSVPFNNTVLRNEGTVTSSSLVNWKRGKECRCCLTGSEAISMTECSARSCAFKCSRSSARTQESAIQV